jgi:hypothetical protein
MLARCIKFDLPNGDYFETPLLLPSFSSKGFPDLKKMIKILEEYITGPVLISAHDIHYNLIQKKINFSTQLLFIDSGGYECSTIGDFSNNNIGVYKPRPWNQVLFYKTVNMLIRDNVPKIIISYDHPKHRQPLSSQINSANTLFKRLDSKGKFVKAILLKPESRNKNKQLLPTEKIITNISKFSSFDIIGLTEKELGDSLLERMMNICRIRRALNSNNMPQLIHIFGSLDTMSTPLYFMCGADIFDGLTWLKYSYSDGMTQYQPNCWIKKRSFDEKDYILRLQSFLDNYSYLKKLSLEMITFKKTGDFKNFGSNGNLFKKVWETCEAKKEGG